MLDIQGLQKAFGGLAAVGDACFSVKAGSVHAVIGPNGAGKTTLFNLISGALKPDAGRVLFEGREITGWSPHRLVRHGLVRTFQRTNVFASASVAENVGLALRSRRGWNFSFRASSRREAEIREETLRILDRLGLAQAADRAAGTLGHGNLKILDIAIGLALQPRIMLMDEPLAGLSRGDRDRLAEIIAMLASDLGVTLLLVEHDIGIVMRLSQRITVLHHGRILAEGTPEMVRADPEVKRAYLGEGGELG